MNKLGYWDSGVPLVVLGKFSREKYFFIFTEIKSLINFHSPFMTLLRSQGKYKRYNKGNVTIKSTKK